MADKQVSVMVIKDDLALDEIMNPTADMNNVVECVLFLV